MLKFTCLLTISPIEWCNNKTHKKITRAGSLNHWVLQLSLLLLLPMTLQMPLPMTVLPIKHGSCKWLLPPSRLVFSKCFRRWSGSPLPFFFLKLLFDVPLSKFGSLEAVAVADPCFKDPVRCLFCSYWVFPTITLRQILCSYCIKISLYS